MWRDQWRRAHHGLANIGARGSGQETGGGVRLRRLQAALSVSQMPPRGGGVLPQYSAGSPQRTRLVIRDPLAFRDVVVDRFIRRCLERVQAELGLELLSTERRHRREPIFDAWDRSKTARCSDRGFWSVSSWALLSPRLTNEISPLGSVQKERQLKPLPTQRYPERVSGRSAARLV